MDQSVSCHRSMWVLFQMLNSHEYLFFLDVLKDKEGISIMADKGFTIRSMLKEIKVDLNIPAFLNEKQFSSEDIQIGRKIASLRIHVERAIGRMKNNFKGDYSNFNG